MTESKDQEDESVARYRETGSREDFEAFARQWLPSIRRFLYVHLGADLQACEEVQQEVLVALVRNLAGFGGKAKFSTFLYRLVHHKAVDYLRKEGRHRRRTLSLDTDAGFEAFEDGDGDPVDTLVRQDTARRLFAHILALPPGERELLHLREIEEMSEKECSVILGVPVGTLKSRLHRLKKKLFDTMTKEGD